MILVKILTIYFLRFIYLTHNIVVLNLWLSLNLLNTKALVKVQHKVGPQTID